VTDTPSSGILLVSGAAIALHLLLFTTTWHKAGNGLEGVLVAPETYFMARKGKQLPDTGSNARTVWSPVMFSLPSDMGFSRDLLQQDVRTRLTFSQQTESEQFLEVDPAARLADERIARQELMLTAGTAAAPGLPDALLQAEERRPAAPRVYVAPELKERLLGGIVLPPELNKEVATPWQARALVSVSEQGTVQHVFLEQPLDTALLNQKVLQLLYSLRFKSGKITDGSIEIYSAGSNSGEPAP
jgi:hypothetical protein